MARALTHRQARRFYDRFGARQDDQSWYEDPATQVLLDTGDWGSAQTVVELGCGTGRFAETLLRQHLSSDADYLGIDVSATMVRLTRERLAPFEDRIDVRLTDGATALDLADATCDRFVSNYVLDLLSEADIRTAVAEAHRVLRPGGRLCLTSLTDGATLYSAFFTTLWRLAHALRPQLVGGCRPLRLTDFVSSPAWALVRHALIPVKGITSEALVVERR